MLGVLCDDLRLIRRKGVGLRPRGDTVKEVNCQRDRRRLWLFHVILKDVSDVRYEEEVEDIVVVFNVKVDRLVVKTLVSKGDNGQEQVLGPSFKSFVQT